MQESNPNAITILKELHVLQRIKVLPQKIRLQIIRLLNPAATSRIISKPKNCVHRKSAAVQLQLTVCIAEVRIFEKRLPGCDVYEGTKFFN